MGPILMLALAFGFADGERLLVVLNKSDATASLLEASTGKTVATLPTGVGPHEVAVHEHVAYVANYGDQKPGNTITVIDLRAREVKATWDLAAQRPHGLELSRDGSRLYVTSEVTQTVRVVDTKDGHVARTLPTAQNLSHMVVVAPDERLAFTANIGSGSISVLDLKDSGAPKAIVTGKGAEGIAITPDGSDVWVANREGDTVSVVDVATREVVDTLDCASFPIRVKITPDGRLALVSAAKSSEVVVFDVESRKEKKRIAMTFQAGADSAERVLGDAFAGKPTPVGIVIEPEGKRAYVANTNADRIAVIDLERLEVVGQYTAGKQPDGLAFAVFARTAAK